MSFYKFAFTPKLYKEYGASLYLENAMEKWGDQIISTLNFLCSTVFYTSPLVATYMYRRNYFATENITLLIKISCSIAAIALGSLALRSLGRTQNSTYVRFIKSLEDVTKKGDKTHLRRFDFDFKFWPVDFSSTAVCVARNATERARAASTLPCQVIAYLAIHTFGIKLIYPGSVKLLQSYLRPMLIQGRSKLVEEEAALRYKIKTSDGNEIDTIFVDNRNKATNGNTLVLCSEGNAGFYEIGIMTTPVALKYSVLGWNHPGFAGSSGSPYPKEDENAALAVIDFAINQLGFIPDNIILFGWSIGAYPTLNIARCHPDVKAVVLDATFDDILPLAIPRMPTSLSGIVRIAVRDYVNLNNSDLITQYAGPIRLIRRTEDEIICTEEGNLSTNRGNHLLLTLLRYRFPNIFKDETLDFAREMLKRPLDGGIDPAIVDTCNSLLSSYVADAGRQFPLLVGEDYNEAQRREMATFLIKKHLSDYKSTHCTPLPTDKFSFWDIAEADFVFT